jgi:hypothetical protein
LFTQIQSPKALPQRRSVQLAHSRRELHGWVARGVVWSAGQTEARLIGPGCVLLDAAVLSLILEARSSASFAEVDTMSVQGLDAPHVLPVFCCVQSSSDETRAAVVKNLGVGGDLELRMLEIVRLG